MAIFEAFCLVISSSINLLFLKSEQLAKISKGGLYIIITDICSNTSKVLCITTMGKQIRSILFSLWRVTIVVFPGVHTYIYVCLSKIGGDMSTKVYLSSFLHTITNFRFWVEKNGLTVLNRPMPNQFAVFLWEKLIKKFWEGR